MDNNQEINFIPRPMPERPEKIVRPLPKPKGGEKWIAVLFFGSIFLSILLWVGGNLANKSFSFNLSLPKGKTSTATPVPSIVPTPTSRIIDEREAKILALTSKLKGKYGVYTYNLTTKSAFTYNAGDIYTAASLMKLPVILTLYQEAEAGRIDLEAKYVLQQEDKRGGAGSLQSKVNGTTYTYKKLAELMGQLSDNTAYMAMRRILGDEKIQQTIDNLGMSKTSLSDDKTTPEDMGLFFRKLYSGSIVTRTHRDEILSFLIDTAYEDRIPKGIPVGIKVAHKIGNEVGVISDAGVVFAPKPFVIVLMSGEILEKEALDVLPKITQIIWDFETAN
jgi:beta-lactamase class A